MTETEEEPDCEFDGPWKEALEWYFQDFLAFFFTAIFERVDWNRGYEFLDQELNKLDPDAATGKGRVDKLAKVWFLDGSERWVYIHIEVQNQQQPNFAERMYTYNHRLRDRYGQMPISVAILGDDRPDWRPSEFVEECGGCSVRFRFVVAKLLEWAGRDAELQASNNPFGIIVQAHLQTQFTRGNPDERQAAKWMLVRGLYDRGYDRLRIVRLFKLIDWVMTLSPPRQVEFNQTIRTFEEGLKVPFVSVLEEIAMEKGIQKEILRSIESILDVRFGVEGVSLMPRVKLVTDYDTLVAIQRRAVTADLAAIAAQLPVDSA
jgi:hypothetical protein